MESLLKSTRPARSRPKAVAPDPDRAPGRLPGRKPCAVIDIGSNSVRLVVYEGLTRSPTPIFNEKALCGLGRHVASERRLDEPAVTAALSALNRYRLLIDQMGVERLHVIATAAVREAENGAQFKADAEEATGCEIDVLSGAEEARLAAYGVLSGLHRPDGIVGDLGGGSLELIDVRDDESGQGVTLPLGGLRLIDVAGQSANKKASIIDRHLDRCALLDDGSKRAFYAVGGTFRALAALHMARKDYPLQITHGYEIDAEEAISFLRYVRRKQPADLKGIERVSSQRQELLGVGARVLEKTLRRARSSKLVFSALGVREGLLFTLLDQAERRRDPLLVAASELGFLRARSPKHAIELVAWTDRFFATLPEHESVDEMRLRHAACYLADIGWRAHPDYRGEQSLNIIANAGFTGINHAGRSYLALAVYYRHSGLSDTELDPRLLDIAGEGLAQRARILAGAFRVAYLVSASMPGILEKTALEIRGSDIVLTLGRGLAALAAPRLSGRVRQLAKVMGLTGAIEIEIE